VTLISGPTQLNVPAGVTRIDVESASDMLTATQNALPVDGAVFAAAVADWRVLNQSDQKVKKKAGALPDLVLAENADILATVSQMTQGRPELVVGFAAETQDILENGSAKLARKGCDWIVANDVSAGSGTFGGDNNSVHLITVTGVESWPSQSKTAVSQQLARQISDYFESR